MRYFYTKIRENTENVLFFFILISLPLQIGKHFWPVFSYVQGIRVDFLSPTLYPADLFILLLFLWICGKTIMPSIAQHNFALTNLRIGLTKQTLLLITLLFVFLLKTLFSGLNSLSWLGKIMEVVWLGWYIAHRDYSLRMLHNIVKVFSVHIVWITLLTTLEFSHHGSLNGLWYFLGERQMSVTTPGAAVAILHGEMALRPYATFPHPNVLGGWMVLVLLLTLGFRQRVGKEGSMQHWHALWTLSLITCGTGTILMTFSRTAVFVWLGLLLGYICIHPKGKRLQRLWLWGFVSVLMGFLLMFEGRYLSFSGYTDAAQSRISLTEIAVAMISAELRH